MYRAGLVALVLACGASAAPFYTAAGVVNASNYSPGPFAPNSVLSIFGTGLSRSTYILTAADIQRNLLPVELNFTRVLVDNSPAPLLYVSESQINFLVPGKQLPGDARIQVVSQAIAGPVITVTLVDVAPALFSQPNDYAIATHADDTLITPESPARPGETVVIYATGLGKTANDPASGEIPFLKAEINARASLDVSLGGTVVYAGLTPGSVGLYQINLILPLHIGPDPELRVTVGSVSSSPASNWQRDSPQLSIGPAR